MFSQHFIMLRAEHTKAKIRPPEAKELIKVITHFPSKDTIVHIFGIETLYNWSILNQGCIHCGYSLLED